MARRGATTRYRPLAAVCATRLERSSTAETLTLGERRAVQPDHSSDERGHAGLCAHDCRCAEQAEHPGARCTPREAAHPNHNHRITARSRAPEAPVGIEPTIAVLQTAALPLGHGAQCASNQSVPPRAARGDETKRVASSHRRHPRVQRGRRSVSCCRPACCSSSRSSCTRSSSSWSCSRSTDWIMAIMAESPLV